MRAWSRTPGRVVCFRTDAQLVRIARLASAEPTTVIWSVAIGGALGALARYAATVGLARLSQGTSLAGYPLGTMAVNVVGSFLLAYLVFQTRLPLSPAIKLGIGTGFLGAMTTFSTFELDTFLLHEQRGWLAAAGFLASNVVLGFLALLLGRHLASGPAA